MHCALLNNDCLWVLDEIQLMGVGLATSKTARPRSGKPERAMSVGELRAKYAQVFGEETRAPQEGCRITGIVSAANYNRQVSPAKESRPKLRNSG